MHKKYGNAINIGTLSRNKVPNDYKVFLFPKIYIKNQ